MSDYTQWKPSNPGSDYPVKWNAAMDQLALDSDKVDSAASGYGFGYKRDTTAGLNIGYYGGVFISGGALTTVADGTIALTASQTNYVERTTAGVVSKNTAGFTAGLIRMFTATTNTTDIIAIVDKRQRNVFGDLKAVGDLTVLGSTSVGGDLKPLNGVIDTATAGVGFNFKANGGSVLTVSTAGSFVYPTAGPHAIGGATSAAVQLLQTGTFAGDASGAIGYELNSTLNPAANGYGLGVYIVPTINKAGSGTHVYIDSLAVASPIIGAGAAALTNATTLRITAAPSVGTNQRAVWVQAGLSQFDGQVQITSSLVVSGGTGATFGAPTGGLKGDGTANFAADIYKNNTAYTNPDYVLEKWATGSIVKYADKAGAEEYEGLMSLEDAEVFAKKNWHLPRFGQAACHGLFSGSDALLASVEESYLYLFDHEHRIKVLEKRTLH